MDHARMEISKMETANQDNNLEIPQEEHFSREDEQGLLGSMIVGGEEVIPDIITNFPDAGFYAPEHRIIRDAIFECYMKLEGTGGSLTITILKDYLERKNLLEDAGGEEYLLERVDKEPGSSVWKFYRNNLLHLLQERRLTKVVRKAGYNDIPITDRLATLQKDTQELQADSGGRTLDLVSFGTMTVKVIDWLWPNKLALGHLNLIAGNGGVGKGQISAWLAALVSRGGEFPDKLGHAPKGDVIFISDEDNPETIILPRLIANNANVHKISIIRGFDKKTNTKFNLSTDIHLLYDTLVDHPNIKLIILDPINEYLQVKSQNDEAAVRQVLTPLMRFAEDNGVAVIGLTHFNKKEKDSFMARVMASGAFLHVARTVWGVIVDKDDPDNRCFMPVKYNICKNAMSMKFVLQDMSPNYPEGDQYCKVVFDPVPFKGLIDDYGKNKFLKVDACSVWLEDILVDGPMDSNDIFDKGEAMGHNRGMIFNSKDKLAGKVICTKKKGFGNDGGFIWQLSTNRAGVGCLTSNIGSELQNGLLCPTEEQNEEV